MFKNLAIAAALATLTTATFADTKKAEAAPAPEATASAEHADKQPAADHAHDAAAKDGKPADTASK